MKYKDINMMFTKKVAEYLAKGWTFNTDTMSSTQGAVASVDLTDGKRIVRINLNKAGYPCDGYEIVVGLADEKYTPNIHGTWPTIWNNELEVLERTGFYRAGIDAKDWFVGREEANNNYEKGIERCHSRYIEDGAFLDERAARIALPYVRRQARCKGAKLSDVKVYRNSKGFYIDYKNNSWLLR